MGLLDMFKDKASELLQGASDKVSEATGIDLPIGDVADQVTESTDGLGETTQGLADAAGDQVTQATDSLGEAGQNLADTATDSVGEAIDPGQKR
jgi:hypothetical protein